MQRLTHESYVGKKFGRLTVVALRPELKCTHSYKEYCDVICDCGHKKTVLLESILRGATTSCGCYAKERASESNTKHGDTKVRPRLYRIWENMRSRCNYAGNTNYKNYGARGICVCDEWNNYENFRSWALSNGYQDNLTIDQIDVNGNYCPENCRWATVKEQDRNKTVNHLLTLGGKTQCIVQWCEELNLNPNTLHKRLKLGWPVEKALLTPIEKKLCFVTINGEKHPLKTWCRILGIPHSTVQNRINKGFAPEEALLKPINKKQRRKKWLNSKVRSTISIVSASASEANGALSTTVQKTLPGHQKTL